MGFGASGKASGGSKFEEYVSDQKSQSARSLQNASSESALATSMSTEGQQMNKSSRDVAVKNVQNIVRKVSAETSQNNKLEVNHSASENELSSTSRKEECTLKNDNTGRTVNYNFHQLQNLYRTELNLKDVKIVVKSGRELVQGTGLQDICVFELEEFNKMYFRMDQTEMSLLVSAKVAYKVLKEYTDFFDDEPQNQGFLKLAEKDWANGAKKYHLINLFKSLKLSASQKIASDITDPAVYYSKRFAELKVALAELKKLTFIFNSEHTPINQSTQVINAPAYHIEAQLGHSSALEPYLEERRKLEIETKMLDLEKQRAEIAKTRALTAHAEGATQHRQFSPTLFQTVHNPMVITPTLANAMAAEHQLRAVELPTFGGQAGR